jgi:nicotinate phosphoribosyltransferase
MRNLVKLETQMLQRVGFSCISAWNAYRMCSELPEVPFLDMAARHCAPDEGGTGMMAACAYGASIGSNQAKLQGAKGFIGSSLDITAHYYGAESGMGTMPHALIGLAGSTARATEMFIEGNPNDKFIVALVDYFGREYTDALECAAWFREAKQPEQGKVLGVRLDTHGGRFAEGLDYESSIAIVEDWLHIKGRWPLVQHVMGHDAFDVVDDAAKDRVAKTLFGTGVSAANIIQMRRILDTHGGDVRGSGKDVKIVASSGFNLRKCRVMARARAPIDMVGTGSFLPDTMPETYATADIVAYDGRPMVKVGREWLRDLVMPHWS